MDKAVILLRQPVMAGKLAMGVNPVTHRPSKPAMDSNKLTAMIQACN